VPKRTQHGHDAARASGLRGELADELRALDDLSTAQLVAKFEEVFGIATRSHHRDYLIKKIAWRLQELAEGGLSERAWTRIADLGDEIPVQWRMRRSAAAAIPTASEPAAAARSRRDPRLPPVGSVIVRTYRGREHHVTVLPSGFEHEGVVHRTLSQVAKAISGQHTSGFAFFASALGGQRRVA